jgi:hypothetical protein
VVNAQDVAAARRLASHRVSTGDPVGLCRAARSARVPDASNQVAAHARGAFMAFLPPTTEVRYARADSLYQYWSWEQAEPVVAG